MMMTGGSSVMDEPTAKRVPARRSLRWLLYLLISLVTGIGLVGFCSGLVLEIYYLKLGGNLLFALGAITGVVTYLHDA